MPDWSYRTLFRPILFRLPEECSRGIALGAIGTLARLPGGGRVIDLMGHMQPSSELELEKGGLRFPSRVGLGFRVDPTGKALPAMARFGFGCLEVGPLEQSVTGDFTPARWHDSRTRATIADQSEDWQVQRETLQAALRSRPPGGPPVLLRVRVDGWVSSPDKTTSALQALGGLALSVEGMVIDAGHQDAGDWLSLIRTATGTVPLIWRHAGMGALSDAVQEALHTGLLQGVLWEPPGELASSRSGGVSPQLPGSVQSLRASLGTEGLLIVRTGASDPQEILDLRDAGADLVFVDWGMVFSGPGLAKRINEAELARQPLPVIPTDPRNVPESWVWTLLQGVGLFVGGWLALAIALSRVMLPYDEDFVGMSREQLCGVNSKLIDFMSHDRVTLAGAMISLGLCYGLLSVYGSRAGRHWAKVTIMTSSFTGFFSFFAFLGYGYFDPFHAFVAAILFQFQLFGLAAPLSALRDRVTPTLCEDQPWRTAQWGQLLLICHAVALFVAGLVIVGIGSTSVFVREDLEFMNTTSAVLAEANPRIIPLVAHDRASFGGMLLGCGLATLLPVLWGFERGRPWLWWMLLASGVAGYGPAIGVHFAVGYTSSWHLAPAFGGASVLGCGLLLSKSYLGWSGIDKR